MSEDRKKHIEESKNQTRCRLRGQTGHLAGEPECNEVDKLSPRREVFKLSGHFGSKSRGKGRGKQRFGGRPTRKDALLRSTSTR